MLSGEVFILGVIAETGRRLDFYIRGRRFLSFRYLSLPPSLGKTGPNGEGKWVNKAKGSALRALSTLEVQGKLSEIHRPQIFRGREFTQWLGKTRMLLRSVIHLVCVAQEEGVKEAEVILRPRELGVAGVEEF